MVQIGNWSGPRMIGKEGMHQTLPGGQPPSRTIGQHPAQQIQRILTGGMKDALQGAWVITVWVVVIGKVDHFGPVFGGGCTKGTVDGVQLGEFAAFAS